MAPDFGKLILNHIPDAVVVTDPDGVVACWTPGAVALFGYAEQEALGRSLAELVAAPAPVGPGLQPGLACQEALLRASDGTLVYVDCSCRAVAAAQGALAYQVWSLKDVTPLKVLRDARLVEARFGDLLESVPDAIVIANAGGRIVLANRQAEALFGYARGELRGLALESLMPQRLRLAHVGHRSGYASRPQPRPMGGGRDLFGLRKGGAEFPVEISLSPVASEEGMLVMSAIRDISARKEIERALHDKNVELVRAVAAKDRFLAGMSHELRTPLNAIIGFAGTMLMKLPGPLNGAQHKQMRTIQTSARQLLALINDLLELTHIESGHIELDLAPLQCRPMLEQLLLQFQPQARDKGLQLEAVSTPSDISVLTDRYAVQQILSNLINNAIKFTEQGNVVVRLSSTAIDDHACVTFSVSDTGIGIAPERHAQLFQAFAALDDGPQRQHQGSGLGLHLSQKLAALLRGRILFESQRGVGSTFTLALPLD
ncbi:MAG: PAS domain-containing sensor histidine kinase [Sphingomonadaceae bacterium]